MSNETMQAETSQYEVRNLGSDTWRAATAQEIAAALAASLSNRFYEWNNGLKTMNWTTVMGLGRAVREFRCTVSR